MRWINAFTWQRLAWFFRIRWNKMKRVHQTQTILKWPFLFDSFLINGINGIVKVFLIRFSVSLDSDWYTVNYFNAFDAKTVVSYL